MVWENFQVAIAIVFVVVIWLYHKISIEMSQKDHQPLKLFFFFMSLWFSIIIIYYARAVAYTNLVDAAQNTSIITIVDTAILTQYPVIVFVLAYFIVYYLQKWFILWFRPK